MVGRRFFYILTSFFLATQIYAQKFYYFKHAPSSKITVTELCNQFDLEKSDKDSFIKFNSVKADSKLTKGKKYKLPIRVYPYSGDNIRSSLGIDNYNTAKKIQEYNEKLKKDGLKKTIPVKGNEIWVPVSYLKEKKQKFEPYTTKFSLFGKAYENVTVSDNKLKNQVFYLISGHGGPDPGANCKKGCNILCEDEYAYDIVLRLARNLMSHGAEVYVIVQDKNDGIRDTHYLDFDNEEVTYDGKKIPLNQVERLKQRTDLINRLYKIHKDKYTQKLIEIHIDSRNEDKKIDLFFYHFPGSEAGKKVADKMLETVKDKYNTHQKDRGYTGAVKERNLYSLRKTLPLCIYIEVGNITNEYDQKRILIPNNRQALANWLAEGLM